MDKLPKSEWNWMSNFGCPIFDLSGSVADAEWPKDILKQHISGKDALYCSGTGYAIANNYIHTVILENIYLRVNMS